MEAFLVSTGIVALGEIGDKTQLLALVLAARFQKPVPIIAGILTATLANHALAGFFGNLIRTVVSPAVLTWLVALSFFAVAAWALLPDKLDDNASPPATRWGIFGVTAAAFFVAEIGDKTQVATVVLAAKYSSLVAVVLGTTLGMLLANVPVVLIGKAASAKIPFKAIRIAAALLFAALGVYALVAPAAAATTTASLAPEARANRFDDPFVQVRRRLPIARRNRPDDHRSGMRAEAASTTRRRSSMSSPCGSARVPSRKFRRQMGRLKSPSRAGAPRRYNSRLPIVAPALESGRAYRLRKSMRPFNPAEIEADVQRQWNEGDVYRAVEATGRRKFYCVSMLPYPSGILHMGHVRNYTIGDMMYRYLRMQGYNVLTPMGWDAFGLPAENAAMKSRVPPAKWTRDNIATMKRQMQAVGLAIDWSREVSTCDPAYYKWNQWFFLKMLEKGIAYKKTGIVNWDPVDQTVLANEQVIDGKGWRSGAPVEKREIPMYYLRITDYADELLDNLDRMTGWPERVRVMQANWIGKSRGVRFAFPHDIRGSDGKLVGDGRMYVFTTRADTIMGVSFCAVAAEHPLAAHAAKSNPALAAFVDECRRGGVSEVDLATMEKKGMSTGLFVTHPLTGEKIEVWVGNYVLMAYGDGAVMGVPAHDERDFAFAKKYGLPIPQVIAVEGETFSTDVWQPWYEDKTRGHCTNSGKYDGLAYEAAVDAIAADLAAKGLGEKRITYRLRDWGVSRQRYWGTPIPIVHCPACGDVPVPEKDLPVVLPEDCVPDGAGNPLAKRADFVDTACPTCRGPAKRETDTLDTFVDSSWYYMRYASPDAPTMVDARNDYWNPMDQYIGGIEHAILHLLYARFWTKVMRDMGLVKFDEPFTRLMTQGMLLNHIFFRRTARGGIDYYAPTDVDVTHDAEGRVAGARLKADGQPVEYGGVGTMSKSKLNGVDPQELIARFGADTARLFVMFAGSPQDSALWSDAGVEGAHRFLRRLWTFALAQRESVRSSRGGGDGGDASPPVKTARREVHLTLKQATYDYERVQYNTVVSAAMKMLNSLEATPADAPGANAFLHEGMSILLRVLYPVAPHIGCALWDELGYPAKLGPLLDAPWPKADPAALAQDEIELVLQVNGKLRGKLTVAAGADKAAIESAARASAEVAKHSAGAAVRRVIVVPGKLVNVVVG